MSWNRELAALIHAELSKRGFKQRGGEYVYFCIFHQDLHNPNLYVNYEKGVFHCFACKAGGSLQNLAEVLGIVEGEMGENLWKMDGLVSKLEPISIEVAKRLAEERGLRLDTVLDMDFKVPDLEEFPEYKDYYILPIKHGKSVVSLIGYAHAKKGGAPKYIHIDGLRNFPFGVDKVQEFGIDKPILVVEGVFDAATAWECGYPAVALLGTARKQSLKFLKHFDKTIILLPDFDAAGRSALYDWAVESLLLGFKKVFVGETEKELPFKDLNDAYRMGIKVGEVLKTLKIVPAVKYLVEEARKRNETMQALALILAPYMDENPADILPLLCEYSSMFLSFFLGSGGVYNENGKEPLQVLHSVSEKDFKVLLVSSLSEYGRRILLDYFLPTEVERLFSFVPLVFSIQHKLPLGIREDEVRGAARRFNYIYRRKKGNPLLSIARSVRRVAALGGVT